jgi:hypothetical protein
MIMLKVLRLLPVLQAIVRSDVYHHTELHHWDDGGYRVCLR